MADFIEVPINDWLASFDGRILEILTPLRQGSMRYHVKLIAQCGTDGNILKVSFFNRDVGLWPFTDFQRPGVEALVRAVEQARQS